MRTGFAIALAVGLVALGTARAQTDAGKAHARVAPVHVAATAAAATADEQRAAKQARRREIVRRWRQASDANAAQVNNAPAQCFSNSGQAMGGFYSGFSTATCYGPP
jgi:hypothetical protein